MTPKIILVNACPMCLVEEETADHLILTYRVAQVLWANVLRWFDHSWVFPHNLKEIFEVWKLKTSFVKGRVGGLIF